MRLERDRGIGGFLPLVEMTGVVVFLPQRRRGFLGVIGGRCPPYVLMVVPKDITRHGLLRASCPAPFGPDAVCSILLRGKLCRFTSSGLHILSHCEERQRRGNLLSDCDTVEDCRASLAMTKNRAGNAHQPPKNLCASAPLR